MLRRDSLGRIEGSVQTDADRQERPCPMAYLERMVQTFTHVKNTKAEKKNRLQHVHNPGIGYVQAGVARHRQRRTSA